ncbi:MAG: hypothetical protein RJQ09_01965 [Cyclobacteriaceae bacterium]
MKISLFVLLNIIALNISAQSTVLSDFETTQTLPDFWTFGCFYEFTENPQRDETNPSLLVGKVHKNARPSMISGLAADLSTSIDLNRSGHLKMKVLALTKAGKVRIKLESPSSSVLYTELYTEIAKTGEWQELIFPLDKADKKYNRIVISFNVGELSDDVYYFDDLIWVPTSKQ